MTDTTLDEFRTEATAFLEANSTRRSTATEFVWGEGDDDVSLFEEFAPDEEARQLAAAKAWLATKAEAGLQWLSGPPALGAGG